jgi:hypothetical protein
MERSGSRRPSPALAIACLALFVALGGTVLAATKIDGRTIRVKSLPGDRLEVGSLPTNRLAPGTIPGNRIAPGSLNGTRIDLGSLGTVPSAAHATSADEARHAQSAANATHAEDSTTVDGHGVGCVGQTREFAGACWDLLTSETTVTATEAAAACAQRGGELPPPLTLLALGRLPGFQIAIDGEWTGQIWMNGETEYSVIAITGDGVTHLRLPTSMQHYRCVIPLID